MSSLAAGLAQRLAGADARKIATWAGDRLRDAVRGMRWHAARLRMWLLDAVPGVGRLPPGSLAASNIREATADDRFYLAQRRRHGPLFKLFWGSGDLKICVVGFPLARRLLARHRDSMHPVSIDISPLVPDEYLRAMRPEIHPHYRRLFKGALGDDLVVAWEPTVRSLIDAELAALAARELDAAATAEGLTAALNRITTRTLLLLVLGVPPASALVPELEAHYQRLGPDGYVADIGPGQRAAYPAIRARVLRIMAAMRERDAGGFADSILRRLLREESAATVDETAIGNAIYMVERGRHDLRDLLRWIVKYLGDHPAVTAELRDRLARGVGGQALAEACVLETLRLDQAEVLNRKVMCPFSFDGFRIPRGSWVSILMRESHRDPASFPEPDAYRPQRFLERSYSTEQYAPFGIDEHQCIGRFLAMRLATIFVEELVGGYIWSVIDDGPRQYGHFHWQPSSRLAIALQRVGR